MKHEKRMKDVCHWFQKKKTLLGNQAPWASKLLSTEYFQWDWNLNVGWNQCWVENENERMKQGLGKMYGPKHDGESGEWRIWHNSEIHEFFGCPNINNRAGSEGRGTWDERGSDSA